MPDPIAACRQSHGRRWRARNIAKTSGEGTGGARPGEAQWPIGPQKTGRGITPHPSDAARQLVVVADARRMGAFNVGSGRVSGSVAHVSKHELVTIVDRTPGTRDQRPAVVCGRTIGQYLESR